MFQTWIEFYYSNQG